MKTAMMSVSSRVPGLILTSVEFLCVSMDPGFLQLPEKHDRRWITLNLWLLWKHGDLGWTGIRSSDHTQCSSSVYLKHLLFQGFFSPKLPLWQSRKSQTYQKKYQHNTACKLGGTPALWCGAIVGIFRNLFSITYLINSKQWVREALCGWLNPTIPVTLFCGIAQIKTSSKRSQ